VIREQSELKKIVPPLYQMYEQMLDVSVGQLASRFSNLHCRGIQRYKELQTVLLTAKVSDVVCEYPELYVVPRHSKRN